MDELRIQIEDITQQDVDKVTEGLEFKQQQESAASMFDPFTALLILGGVIAGAMLVMRLVNEWRGGVIVNVKGDPVKVSRHKELPYGFFLIVAKNGDVRVEAPKEPEDRLERMLKAVLELIVPSAEDVKAVVEKHLGADAIGS
jgi:hypothetical protein